MRTSSRFVGALAAAASFLPSALGQNNEPVTFTDAESGIVFNSWTVPGDTGQTQGGFTFGMALPSDALTTDANEFIGYLKCAAADNKGWCGVSLAGPMTNGLLITAWPNADTVYTSLRFAGGYSMPDLYAGDAKITQIRSSIDSEHFTLVFRCQNCLHWNQGGSEGGISTSSGFAVLGWVQAFPSPGNPTCPDQISLEQHDNGMGIWGAVLDSNAANPSYSAWAAKATKTVTGTCGGPTQSSVVGQPVPTGATFDYIVVGGGAGGIPIADRLSEAGKKVLLIEKGFASTAEHGGDLGPDWLDGNKLTRFDVPGLCNQIWVDSKGIACDDTDQMAGCVLGGGTAVNAGLWFKPYSLDWDYLFPTGWKSRDISAAINKVFSRIPGTDTPSTDGKRYLQQGFDVLANGLGQGGWSKVTANSSPDRKNRTYSNAPFMFSGGQRGGPLATYLTSAKKRSNFNLWLNTSVRRVIREGGHITGVEVQPFRTGGYQGIVNVTNISGRVILSAGTFGSAKILLRSGIGPEDQLQVVKSSTIDGPTMINSTSWIPLPVGYNLDDHLNTDTVISHPNVVFYDFYQAWNTPIEADKNLYLSKRSGILAQAAPNIGPMFWEEIKGADGKVRQIQWTARVEGSLGTPNGKAMTMSQYLGRGATSRGRMTITPSLSTVVSDVPYLKDPNDKEAVIQGIINLQNALKNVANLTWNFPDPSTSPRDYVNNMVVSPGNRRSNHWMGTAKLGTDDGRQNGGSAVVDLNTKVWGTDNLFVVDASIFPGVPTTNPSSYIVTAAEHASQKILALAAPKPIPKYGQCGGRQWTGSFTCVAGTKCTVKDQWYSQCL
ncbi:carbohydrate-binding module family 1 protein [Parathielavia appendiculata]|uniref:Carbohydrate-binding module family 1 protein n=1 Tax=Parathielavia appendiculata TaxID=2587402 RepID=A0AAN6TZ92_9PEZI|nr:carbohydrate-binding module family 1 protein [Parathielavia appendiculata]